MQIDEKTAQLNNQAFLCEMRNFPSINFENISSKLAKFDSLIPEEQANIGLAYYLGEGIKKDKTKALEIWNNLNCGLSLFYQSIDAFIKKDENNGFLKLKESAKKGNKQAFLRLGYCYVMGMGTPIDIERAYKIFDKLAHEKIPEAVYFVGAMQMLPGQDFIEFNIEKAQQKLLWSAEHGCKFAEFEQGMLLLNNAKSEEDKQKALRLVKQSAEKQEVRAMMWLAIEYSRGIILPINKELAEKYMEKCIKLDFEPAVLAFKEALKKI